MTASEQTRVLVFARAPDPGSVKTRLIPLLGGHGAAALYRSLTEHALATARDAALGPVELWCTPTKDHEFFRSCGERYPVELHLQCEGDLGARMRHALDDALSRARYALLTGSDCPSLNAADLRAAARALHESRDAVFCPAEDGGYLLIGLAHAMPALFDGMNWGTANVMEETRRRLRLLAWRWHELPAQWDLDRPEDYERLVREGWVPATDPGDEP